jgi:hypothetical protein
MRSILRRLAGDRGFALPVALATTVVLGISVTATISYTTSNQRAAASSKSRTAAYFYAESGINNAMSILRLGTNNALDKYVFCTDAASLPALPCVHTDNYDGGRVVWSGALVQNPAAGSAYWDLTSTGYVRNPSTAGDSSRTLRATIPVIPVLQQPLNNPSWDYIFVRAPTWSHVAYSGCDMTLQQSVDVQAPLYVLGNLCFQNKAKMSKGKLVVSGSVDLQQSANQIGAAGADITSANIGLGCRYSQNSTSHNPCRYGAGGSPSFFDNVWAANFVTNASTGIKELPNSVPTITPPVVHWDDWYLNASPGPYYACATPQAGDPPLPPFAFDSPVGSLSDTDANKLAYKNDNQGIANLTPGSSYKCKTTSGELSWDYTNKLLTVSGTVFIDGSAKIDIGGTILYKGASTVYLSGSLLIKNTKVCAYGTTTSCTLSLWDSTKDLLAFVVNGNGSVPADSQVPTGDSIQVVSGYFQGALYATNALDIDTTALVDGPMDGSTVKLGQSSNSTFSGFTTVPVGMPGNNTIFALSLAPQVSGG